VISLGVGFSRPRTLNRILVAAPLAFWVGGAVAFNTDISLPTCPFKALTGIDCPGCGSTRAGASLLRGDVVAALDHHALLISAPVVIAALWALSRVVPAAKPLWGALAARPALIALAVIGSFWGFRLLPFAPFDVLASS
jgi:hypothetical protein